MLHALATKLFLLLIPQKRSSKQASGPLSIFIYLTRDLVAVFSDLFSRFYLTQISLPLLKLV